MWKYYAILAAFFAALTALFAKLGVRAVDSNLATAIRTAVVLAIVWGVVFVTGAESGIRGLSRTNWIFLILSGAATGLSWLFYFKALSTGPVSRVAPLDKLSVAFTIVLGILVLGEPAAPKTLLGGVLILAGSLVMLL